MIDLTNVDISNIKQIKGSKITIEQEIEFVGPIEEIKFISPIAVKLHLVNISCAIRVIGSLKGEVSLQCSRCLEVFYYKLERDFKIDLCEKRHQIASEEAELKREDLEKSFYEGDNVNLIDEIREQIVLSLPMKPVCKEDCLGLCSNCGVNLNKSACNCSLENIDLRWVKLKEVLKNG